MYFMLLRNTPKYYYKCNLKKCDTDIYEDWRTITLLQQQYKVHWIKDKT
jgi:hypothetical protein